MTNEELLIKLTEQIKKQIRGLEEEFEAEELAEGFDRDEFDKGYLAGMQAVLLEVKLVQDGSIELK
jgi:hypothetical protein